MPVLGLRESRTPRPNASRARRKRPPPKLKGSHTATITLHSDSPTVGEVQDWLSVQVPYPNLAEDKTVAERALTFALEQKRWYADRTFELKDKWRALDMLLRGTSLSQRFPQSDIHVPELYKMMETAVPRIEEAVFGAGPGQPWFNVIGRELTDKRRAWRIRAWLEYLKDQGELDGQIQEIARCMFQYGFFAVKSWWDIRFERRIKRESEKIEPDADGNPRVRIVAREEEMLVYYGPRYMLVDPYDWLVDVSKTSAQKGLFCGDISDTTLEDLKQEEKLGLVTNLSELEEEAPRKFDGTDRGWSKRERALTMSTGVEDRRRSEGQPAYMEQIELWARWDPYGDGNAEEYKIRVVNESLVVEVRKNYHDDRHRPYAVGRAAREPFDFHNVGPLDHAVRLNMEYDDHRNLAMKAHQNALCPLTFVRNPDNLPENLFDVEPGQVLATTEPPTFFAAPPVAHIMTFMDQVSRRDIEEATGMPRIYEGTSGGDKTATTTERKVEEANRRLKGVIRSFGFGMAELLRHTYALSSQYTTRRETFRVLGADAAKGRLGSVSEIGPEDLGLPIDFEIVGLASIHTLGLRATNIATFFNQMYPIAANFLPPDAVDWVRLMEIQWDATVGVVPGEELFRRQPNADDLLDPYEENLLLSMGQPAPVQEGDNDEEHIRAHQARWRAGRLDQEAADMLFNHIAQHVRQRQVKAARQRIQQERQQQMMQQQAEEERPMGQKGRGSGREPDLAGQFPGRSVSGETPGPPRQQAVAAGDRSYATPSGQNRAG